MYSFFIAFYSFCIALYSYKKTFYSYKKAIKSYKKLLGSSLEASWVAPWKASWEAHGKLPSRGFLYRILIVAEAGSDPREPAAGDSSGLTRAGTGWRGAPADRCPGWSAVLGSSSGAPWEASWGSLLGSLLGSSWEAPGRLPEKNRINDSNQRIESMNRSMNRIKEPNQGIESMNRINELNQWIESKNRINECG